jgi:hypothetical protein
MRPLILISVLLGCINLKADDLQLEGPYVLPQYPELYSRAWVGATFELEAQALNGTVNEIKIQSFNTSVLQPPLPHHPPPDR